MARPITNLLLLSLSLASCHASGPQESWAETRCKIALQHIKAFARSAGRPIAVSRIAEPPPFESSQIESFIKENPNLKNSASVKLALEQISVQNISVVNQCYEVETWLNNNNVMNDEAAIENAMFEKPWPVATLRLSMPVLSNKGDTAVFFSAEYWAMLGGGVDLVTYRRNRDGSWSFMKRDGMSVS